MRKLLILLLLIAGCKTDDKTICGQIKFLKNTVILNGQNITKPQEFCANDILETKYDSAAVIQFSSYAIITVKQNSKLKLNKAKNLDPHKIYTSLYQISGSTFSKVNHNKADYFISTPTIVAGVRGTSFEIINNDKETEIKVFDGRVSLRRHNSKIAIDDERRKVYVNTQEKVTITENNIYKPQKLNEMEHSRLKLMRQINPNDKELNKHLYTNLSKDSLTLNIVPEKKFIYKLTIEDLVKLYGGVSRISLRNGYEYIGAFKQTGDNVAIFTTTKTFYVKSYTIEKIIPYK